MDSERRRQPDGDALRRDRGGSAGAAMTTARPVRPRIFLEERKGLERSYFITHTL
jgi:hypothetical protein